MESIWLWKIKKIGCMRLRMDKYLALPVMILRQKVFWGPIGVLQESRGEDIGQALLIRTLTAMREYGYGYAIIGMECFIRIPPVFSWEEISPGCKNKVEGFISFVCSICLLACCWLFG